MMKGGTQGIDIRQRGGFAAILFRRRITFRADHGAFLPGLKGSGNAKIHKHHIAAAVDHDVRGLHITEDDGIRFVIVQEIQHFAQLNPPCQNPFLRQKAPGIVNDRLQVFTVNEFQDQIGTVFLGKIIVNARDGWMVQRCQNIGFALEIVDDRHARVGVRCNIEHLLDSHQLGDIGKMHIAGAINRSHAANADHFLNMIPVDQRCAGLQLPMGAMSRLFAHRLCEVMFVQTASPFPKL